VQETPGPECRPDQGCYRTYPDVITHIRRVGQSTTARKLQANVLGQVLGQVADAPVGVAGSGDDALGVESLPEPGDVQRLVLVADGIKAAALRGTASGAPRAGLWPWGGPAQRVRAAPALAVALT
jgi:hypothetical protein